MTNNNVGDDEIIMDEDLDAMEDPQPYEHANVPEIELTPTKSLNIPIPGKNSSKRQIYDNMTSDDDLDVDMSHLDIERQQYPLSDMDSPLSSPLASSPISEAYYRNIHSDTEAEKETMSHHCVADDTKIKWEWGELPEVSHGVIYGQNVLGGKRAILLKVPGGNSLWKDKFLRIENVFNHEYFHLIRKLYSMYSI